MPRGCLQVWDSNKGTCVISFDDCVSSEITQLRVDKPGRRFIVGTHEGKVQAHGLGTGTVSHHFARHSKEVTFLHFDAMQYQVISAGLDGMLYFFPGDATVTDPPTSLSPRYRTAKNVLYTPAPKAQL